MCLRRVRRFCSLAAFVSVAAASSTTAGEPGVAPVVSAEYANKAERQASAALEAALDRPLPDLKAAVGGKDDVPLRELLVAFGKALKVPVLLDEQTFAEAGVNIDDSVLVPSYSAAGISARAALEMMLDPWDLSYENRAGVLKVTTVEITDEYLVTRVYDVHDLVADRPQAVEIPAVTLPAGGTVAEVRQSPQVELEDVLQEITSGPWFDIDGIGGGIRTYGGRLAVRQTQRLHREVTGLLAAVRQARAAEPGAPGAEAEYASETDRAAAAKLRAALDGPLPDLPGSGVGRPKLRERLLEVAKAAGIVLEFDEVALTDAGIDLDQEDAAPLPSDVHILVRAAIERLLEPHDLTFWERSGILIVTTEEIAEERMVTRVYGVRDLLAGVPAVIRVPKEPPTFEGIGGLMSVPAGGSLPSGASPATGAPSQIGPRCIEGGGVAKGAVAEKKPPAEPKRYMAGEQLADLLASCTAGPWWEIDGVGGAIAVYGDVIAVRQTEAVQREVESLSAALREARGEKVKEDGAERAGGK